MNTQLQKIDVHGSRARRQERELPHLRKIETPVRRLDPSAWADLWQEDFEREARKMEAER